MNDQSETSPSLPLEPDHETATVDHDYTSTLGPRSSATSDLPRTIDLLDAHVTPPSIIAPPVSVELGESLVCSNRVTVSPSERANADGQSADRAASTDHMEIDAATSHRHALLLTRAQHHKTFLEKCIDENVVPKGMRLNISLNFISPDCTDINEKVQEIIQRAQRDILAASLHHYVQLESKLTENAPAAPDESATAQRFCETVENLRLHLSTRREHKLAALTAPPTLVCSKLSN